MTATLFWRSFRHPLPILQLVLYLCLTFKVVKDGHNLVVLVLPFLVLLFLASLIVTSLQTGKLLSLRSGGADRRSDPKRYWFHLVTQFVIWAACNVLFAYAFWSGVAFRLAPQGK